MDFHLFNSLTRNKDLFDPIEPSEIKLYTCGITAYDYAHIGHGRKYVMDDVLKRALTYNGFKVKHVQNVTDVGHLVSDADEGEDKLEKGASKHGKTVWEVAEFFANNFYSSMDKLNILRPDIVCKATDHIPEQIDLIQKLFDNGYAYDTPEAVYFDVSKFSGYGAMFGQKIEDKKVGVRQEVRTDENKRNAVDFSLWFKRVGKYSDHVMHWDSPWGDGFPGWHIECSAMSMKYLGEQLDIHTGGEDHLSIHHPNEIAQSEAATGKIPFSKFWVHHAFLTVDGTKMSKSLGNYYTVSDIVQKGYDPIALRYLYLSAHYKKPMNFTWEALDAASIGLKRLRSVVLTLKNSKRTVLSEEKNEKLESFTSEFNLSINDDLNIPQALSVVWEVAKSSIPSTDKLDLILDFDSVFGLGLGSYKEEKSEVPQEVLNLLEQRNKAREDKDFNLSDQIRSKIEELGYKIEDSTSGAKVVKD